MALYLALSLTLSYSYTSVLSLRRCFTSLNSHIIYHKTLKSYQYRYFPINFISSIIHQSTDRGPLYTRAYALSVFQNTMTTLSDDSISLSFNNSNLRLLPVDVLDVDTTRSRSVRGAIFARAFPERVSNPSLVAASNDALDLIGVSYATEISQSHVNTNKMLSEQDLATYFSGNKLFQGSETAAHCYAGHQFGSFAGQLGDGTVIYLGEVVNDKGEKWELQLKGAGR